MIVFYAQVNHLDDPARDLLVEVIVEMDAGYLAWVVAERERTKNQMPKPEARRG